MAASRRAFYPTRGGPPRRSGGPLSTIAVARAGRKLQCREAGEGVAVLGSRRGQWAVALLLAAGVAAAAWVWDRGRGRARCVGEGDVRVIAWIGADQRGRTAEFVHRDDFGDRLPQRLGVPILPDGSARFLIPRVTVSWVDGSPRRSVNLSGWTLEYDGQSLDLQDEVWRHGAVPNGGGLLTLEVAP